MKRKPAVQPFADTVMLDGGDDSRARSAMPRARRAQVQADPGHAADAKPAAGRKAPVKSPASGASVGSVVGKIPGLLRLLRRTAPPSVRLPHARFSSTHCAAIGKHGAKLIRNGMRVLTHCNAGWLAFVDLGSATAPIYAAQAAGRKFHVFCDETRPRSQGATLTAWELAQQGVSHQILADNAAGHLMQRGEIDLVIVGSDRTLGRTGEVANKIGTYTKAVLAKRHQIPFYVAIPLSTIDWQLRRGFDIPIEERHEHEVLGAWGVVADPRSKAQGLKSGQRAYVRVANPTSGARNPGFDVTPAELITGIITPVGIFKPTELWQRRQKLGFPGKD